MYHLSVVTLLIVAVTLLLSAGLHVSSCYVAVDIACNGPTSRTSAVLCALSLCVYRVSFVLSQSLAVARLARVWDVLSPLAAGSQPPRITIEAYELIRQLCILLRSIGYSVLDVLPRATPYLPILHSLSWMLFSCCVYALLYGAPMIVYYCLIVARNVVTVVEPDKEPELEYPYKMMRRRKLPRMLQEKRKREQEQAAQREAEREKARLAQLALSKLDSCKTQAPESTSTETNAVCTRVDSADSVSVYKPKAERSDAVTPASSPDLLRSAPIPPVRSDSDTSPTSTDTSSPGSSIDGIANDLATTITEHHKDSRAPERAGASSAKDTNDKADSMESSETRQHEATSRTPTVSALENDQNVSVVQLETIAAHDSHMDSPRPVSLPSTATSSEAGQVLQPSTDHVVEAPVDIPIEFSAILDELLAIPEVPALLQMTAAELDSALLESVIAPSPNWIATNDNPTNMDSDVDSEASVAGSRALQDPTFFTASALENNSSELCDTAYASSSLDGTTATSLMDEHMATEQVDAALDLLDAELTRTGVDAAGIALRLGLEVPTVRWTMFDPALALVSGSTSTSSTATTEDPAFEALDAMWASMGIDPTVPEHMDIDLDAMMKLDCAPVDKASGCNVEIDLESNSFVPEERAIAFPTDDPTPNASETALDWEPRLSEEEHLAILAQLREEDAHVTVGDIDLDEIPATFDGEPTGCQTMMEPLDSTPTSQSFDRGNCDSSMSDEECIAVLAELCKDIIPPANPEADLEKTLAMLDEMMAVTTLGDMDLGEAPGSSNGDPAAESSVLATTYGSRTVGDCDASMSDEECIAQLAELCKDITPPTNPEAELEKTLAWLDAMMSGTEDGVTQSAGGSSASQVSCAMENDSTSTGSNGCMRLEDLIDYAMVLDAALEVDLSESENGSEYLETPTDDGSMDLDGEIVAVGWKGSESCEPRTMCPLDMYY